MDRTTVVKAGNNVTGAMNYVTVVTNIDITSSGDYKDQSQRNWDSIITVISMRAQPIILNEPIKVSDLSEYGTKHLSGEGYMFSFAVEHENIFAELNDNLEVIDHYAKLKQIVDGITLGNILVSTYNNPNIEFL